jgi:hypothetical protein
MPYVKINGKYRYVNPNKYQPSITDKKGKFVNAEINKYLEQEANAQAGVVTVDGLSYSVAPSKQTEFLKNLPPKQTYAKRQQLLQQKYYGELKSSTPNLDKLKNLSLSTIRNNFNRKVANKIIEYRNQPLRKINQDLSLLPANIMIKTGEGVNVLTSAVVERRTKQIQKLKDSIEKKQKAGKVPVFDSIRYAKLRGERGVIRAVGDTALLVAIVPKLPEATFLFLSDTPIQKTKKFLMGKPIRTEAKRIIQNIKSSPLESASYFATQYFIFGNKLKAGKLKPNVKIEKVVIKENTLKGYQDGLYYKWFGKDNPKVIKFKTDLDVNLKKLKTKLNSIAETMYKKYKPEGEFKPIFKNAGRLEIPQNLKLSKLRGKTLKNIELTFRKAGYDTLSFKAQAKIIGKKLNLVSAQADRLVYLLRQSRKIQKPIAGLKLTKKGITLLNKLNKGGTLTKLEVKYLDMQFKRTNKGLLAKSFFASPSTQVRVSRLMLNQREAGLIDIFKGNFQLKRNKPQILLFKNQRITLPKKLKGIQNKLLSGKSLTQSEKLDLLTYQLKRTGRFKPIGFITKEAEVTLAPNEIIRKVKRLSSVTIKGRKIPIIQAEVVKIKSPLTRNLMNRLNKGARLTKEEIRKLNRGIEKESGFKSSYSSYSGKAKPYLNLKSKLLSFSILYKAKSPINSYARGGSGKSGGSYTGGISKGGSGGYVVSGMTYARGGSGYIKPTPVYTYKPTGKYTPRQIPPYKPTPVYYPRGKPPVKKILFARGELKKINKKNLKTGYYVYGLSRGKYVKLNKRPLLKQDALSRGSYAIDRTTAKTFKLVPIRKVKKFGTLLHRERGYYTKAGYKFREYKVRKGKAYSLIMKQIEKRKYGIDTLGEKRGLTLARYLSRLKKSKY